MTVFKSVPVSSLSWCSSSWASPIFGLNGVSESENETSPLQITRKSHMYRTFFMLMQDQLNLGRRKRQEFCVPLKAN